MGDIRQSNCKSGIMQFSHKPFILLLFLLSLAVGFKNSTVVTDADFLNGRVMTANNTVNGVWFIKFYAPWCGHCKRMAPIWEELAEEMKNSYVHIASLDCTENRDACERIEISGYPSLYVLDGGKAYQFKGARTFDNLRLFVTSRGYLQMGIETPIIPDSEVPKSSVGKMYKEFSKSLDSTFQALGLGVVPHFAQIMIVIGICCIPLALIIYAICYPDEEYEQMRQMKEEQDKAEEDQAKEKQQAKKND